jgi:hypothetical protein
MKIDLSREFIGIDGKPIIALDTEKPLTLKHVLIQACLAANTPEQEKIHRYSIYRTIQKAGDGIVHLKAEDIVILKKAVLQVCQVLICGQAHEMLEHDKDENFL